MISGIHHQDVRTTLTLDEDVAAKLTREARRSGRPFRDVVNETLRRGLLTAAPGPRRKFQVKARSLGGLRSGLQLDDIGGLLARIEGRRRT
jgi:hypothetical protein